MTDHTATLAELATRVERLSTSPEEVGGRFAKLFGGLYRFFGWQAKFSSSALRKLLDELASAPLLCADYLELAVREVEENVERAERAVAVHRYVPTAHASWLGRVLSTLARVNDLAKDATPAAMRALSGLDTTRVLPPLRLTDEAVAAAEAKDRQEREKDPGFARPDAGRILELQLAAIDHITEAARSETQLLERRRRLLEGARRLLLDASAALPLEAEGVRAREHFLANEITKLDRLQAVGVDPRVSLVYQAKTLVRRGDRDRLYATLVALDGFALANGDRARSEKTGAALDALVGRDRYTNGAVTDAQKKESLGRSARELFGDRVVETIENGYAGLRTRLEKSTTEDDAELRGLAQTFLAPGGEDAALAALVSVDGCFEVGAALSPVRAREIEEVARLVSHPTEEMLLVQARSIDDVPNAIFDDPRRILLDLAAGRLLSRKYVHRSRREYDRTKLVGEARVYVLDGSTSMYLSGDTARARMRDAIMIAELSTMLRRLEDKDRGVRLSLYYRYFTLKLEELKIVRTSGEVLAAMADVIGNPRKGGTDIQSALLSSFELIRDTKRNDPDLARANIVLVTDGEAPVDAELVRKAREEASNVAVGVSVIALGQENPVLRDLVARQRARGERAFYHHIDDDRLIALCKGEGANLSLHRNIAEPIDPEAVKRKLEDVIVELEDLDAARRVGTVSDPTTRLEDGRKAVEEACLRDIRALERRFARWFPTVPEEEAKIDRVHLREVDTIAGADCDAVKIVLGTVSEIVSELGTDVLQRRADAIELVERLLLDSRLTPAKYHAFLETHRVHVAGELASVHAAAAGAEASFAHRLSAKSAQDKKADAKQPGSRGFRPRGR